MNFKNKNVLITGASQGLGLALAKAFVEKGANVVIIARNDEKLTQAVAALKIEGGNVLGIAANVGDKDAIYKIAGQAAAFYGQTDILINNASTLGVTPLELLMDTACEDLATVLEVNLIGPFRLIKALAGPMLLRDHGLVLNISSDAATEAYRRWGAYGVSKAALAHLTRIFSTELSESNVRFLNFDPGEMDTQMHRDAIPEADPATLAKPSTVAEKILHFIKDTYEHSH